MPLVREIRPYDIIKNMSSDRIDGRRQRNNGLGFTTVFQRWRVDTHATDVVEMRVSNEKGMQQLAKYIQGIGFGRYTRTSDAGERTIRQGFGVVFGRDGFAVPW